MDTKTTKTPNKRLRPSSDTSPECIQTTFFEYIIIHATDQPLRLSPFAIQKQLEALVGKDNNVKRLRSGDLLVRVWDAKQSDRLLKAKTFVNVPVTCYHHGTLNFTKGVIYHPELQYSNKEEVKQELADQGVVEATPLGRRGAYLLKFKKSVLPPAVKVGYLVLNVKQFIPNPLRCYKCQRYGHGSRNCTRSVDTCDNCGDDGHTRMECNEEPYCINCKGPHPSSSPKCPMWLKEKEVSRIRVERDVTFSEARRIVNTSAASSYASVARKTFKDMSTQTGPDTPDKGITAPKQPVASKTQSELQGPSRPQNNTKIQHDLPKAHPIRHFAPPSPSNTAKQTKTNDPSKKMDSRAGGQAQGNSGARKREISPITVSAESKAELMGRTEQVKEKVKEQVKAGVAANKFAALSTPIETPLPLNRRPGKTHFRNRTISK